MPGLIDDTVGLYYGNGLYFEPGLGGAGLTNTSAIDTGLLAGTGTLAVSANVKLSAQVTFAGGGRMSVMAS